MNIIPHRQPQHATGCVETGIDFSFRSAFRESRGLVSLLQIEALKAGGNGLGPL
jgi:hypothetical protein